MPSLSLTQFVPLTFSPYFLTLTFCPLISIPHILTCTSTALSAAHFWHILHSKPPFLPYILHPSFSALTVYSALTTCHILPHTFCALLVELSFYPLFSGPHFPTLTLTSHFLTLAMCPHFLLLTFNPSCSASRFLCIKTSSSLIKYCSSLCTLLQRFDSSAWWSMPCDVFWILSQHSPIGLRIYCLNWFERSELIDEANEWTTDSPTDGMGCAWSVRLGGGWHVSSAVTQDICVPRYINLKVLNNILKIPSPIWPVNGQEFSSDNGEAEVFSSKY